MPTTLIVGALLAEVVPLFNCLDHPLPLNHRLMRGTINGQEILVLRCGVGVQKAYKYTLQTLQRFSINRVISVGTCGALSNDLRIGDVCTVNQIHNEAGNSIRISALDNFIQKRLITVSTVVSTEAKRKELSQIADICEMEAYGVWKAAQGIPFYCLKVVSDQAGKGADPVLDASTPKSQQVARFMLRAGLLCHRHLQPAVIKIHSSHHRS